MNGTSKKLLLASLVAPALLLTGCQSRQFSLRGIDRPVVLGKRLHVGDKAKFDVRIDPKRAYKAETYVSLAASSGSSTSHHGSYATTTTVTSSQKNTYDNTRSQAHKVVGNTYNKSIRNCRVQAYSWFMNGLMVLWNKTGFNASGEVASTRYRKTETVAKTTEEN